VTGADEYFFGEIPVESAAEMSTIIF